MYEILASSALGLVDVYNLLPQNTVDADSVSTFQKRLQLDLIDAAERQMPGWRDMYSPRLDMYAHPLRDQMGINENDANLEAANGGMRKSNACVNAWLDFGQ